MLHRPIQRFAFVSVHRGARALLHRRRCAPVPGGCLCGGGIRGPSARALRHCTPNTDLTLELTRSQCLLLFFSLVLQHVHFWSSTALRLSTLTVLRRIALFCLRRSLLYLVLLLAHLILLPGFPCAMAPAKKQPPAAGKPPTAAGAAEPRLDAGSSPTQGQDQHSPEVALLILACNEQQ